MSMSWFNSNYLAMIVSNLIILSNQIFFHKYFTQKHAGKDLRKVKKKKQNSEEDFPFVELDEGGDEDYENEIWKAMKSELPFDLDSDLEDDEENDDLENYEFTSEDSIEANV